MLYSLQYLRGIASILVVLYHARGDLNGIYGTVNFGDILFSNGYVGVDLFFIISGFVIMLSTEKDNSCISFTIKRFFRLYPAYLACLVITVLLFNKPIDFSLLKAIFFINENINDTPPWFGYTIVFTAWTLMYEIIFYIYFTISMALSKKYRDVVCSFLMICAMASIYIFTESEFSFSGYSAVLIDSRIGPFGDLLRVLSSPMFIEFSVGMLIYRIYKSNVLSTATNLSTLLFFVSISAFAFFYFTGKNGGHGIIAGGMYSSLLLLGLVMYEKTHKIKKIKPLYYLGDISYSLYLTHPIIINMLSFGIVSVFSYSEGGGIINLITIMSISVVLSTILYIFIEKPFVGIARNIISFSMVGGGRRANEKI